MAFFQLLQYVCLFVCLCLKEELFGHQPNGRMVFWVPQVRLQSYVLTPFRKARKMGACPPLGREYSTGQGQGSSSRFLIYALCIFHLWVWVQACLQASVWYFHTLSSFQQKIEYVNIKQQFVYCFKNIT